MVRKKTHEEFVNEVYSLVGNEYLVISNYVNSSTKIKIKHNKCDRIYEVTPNSFLSRGRRCKNCKDKERAETLRKPKSQFLDEVNSLVGGEYEVLDEYVDTVTKLRFKHIPCKNIHEIEPVNFLRGRGMCQFCSGIRKNTKIFKDEVYKLVDSEYEVLSEYKSTHEKVLMKHNECGNEYYVAPSCFLIGQRCPNCYGYKKRTTEEFKGEVLKLTSNEYEVLGEYIDAKTKISIKHSICGNIWDVTPDSFINLNTRCPKCKLSKGEKIIDEWLFNNKLIKYVKQFKILDCSHKRPLPFDFAVFSQNKLVGIIEYDGIQHFKPVDYFGGEKYFRDIKRNDLIKNKYCESNNIPLLRISYKEFDNIDLILDSFINKTITERVG